MNAYEILEELDRVVSRACDNVRRSVRDGRGFGGELMASTVKQEVEEAIEYLERRQAYHERWIAQAQDVLDRAIAHKEQDQKRLAEYREVLKTMAEAGVWEA